MNAKRSLYPMKYFQLFKGRRQFRPGKLVGIEFALEVVSRLTGKKLREATKQSSSVWEINGTDFLLVHNKKWL